MLKDYPSVSLQEEQIEDKINFPQLFENDNPVEIEVGSGKGTFLVNQAKANPEINYLGIEWARKFYRHAVDRIGRWGLKNVRIIRTDANTFFSRFIQAGSVDRIHVYFPDPWPKKRHHKRRFFDDAILEDLLKCLKPGGIVQVATDHPGYFQQMQEVLNNAREKAKVEPTEFTRPAGAENNEVVGTNFERKYVKDKKPIYSAAARKL